MDISRTKITDKGLRELAKNQFLIQIVTTGSGVTATGLQEVASLRRNGWLNRENTNLRNLPLSGPLSGGTVRGVDFSETPLSDETFQNQPALQRVAGLKLDGTRVTDRVVTILNGKDISLLSLARTSITDTGLMDLKLENTLTHLNLDQTAVGDRSLENISRHRMMTALSLGGTKVTDQGMASLRRLDKLAHLSLE
jgi:hypothetical protein